MSEARRRIFAALVLASVCVPLAGAADRDAHTLTMTRRIAVGTRYQESATGSLTRGGTREHGGRTAPVATQRLTVAFRAEAEVAGVDAAGRVNKVRYKIIQCVAQRDAEPKRAIIAPNLIVIATQTESATAFEIEGEGAVDATRAQALALVVRMPSATAADFDAVWGPGKPVRIGEKWAVNDAAYRKELAASGLDASGARIESRVELIGVSKSPAGDVHEVKAYARAAPLRQPAAAGDIDARDTTVTLTADFTVHAPADQRQPIPRENGSVEMAMDITGVGPDEQPMIVHGTIRRTLDLTRTPIK